MIEFIKQIWPCLAGFLIAIIVVLADVYELEHVKEIVMGLLVAPAMILLGVLWLNASRRIVSAEEREGKDHESERLILLIYNLFFGVLLIVAGVYIVYLTLKPWLN